MTPTEILIAVALTATLFGFTIRHAWAEFHFDKDALDLINFWEKSYNALKRHQDYQVGQTFNLGFRAGVQMADDEEAEDELEEEVTWPLHTKSQAIPAVFLTNPAVFLTNEEINQLLTKTNFNR